MARAVRGAYVSRGVIPLHAIALQPPLLQVASNRQTAANRSPMATLAISVISPEPEAEQWGSKRCCVWSHSCSLVSLLVHRFAFTVLASWGRGCCAGFPRRRWLPTQPGCFITAVSWSLSGAPGTQGCCGWRSPAPSRSFGGWRGFTQPRRGCCLRCLPAPGGGYLAPGLLPLGASVSPSSAGSAASCRASRQGVSAPIQFACLFSPLVSRLVMFSLLSGVLPSITRVLPPIGPQFPVDPSTLTPGKWADLALTGHHVYYDEGHWYLLTASSYIDRQSLLVLWAQFEQ